ncbi:MAG: hypothetical protein U0X40_05120 [Ferruginibacter sp.]
MKTFLPLKSIFVFASFISLISSSCKKTDTADMQPREQLIVGTWYIDRMQLKIYSGSTFITDTIIKRNPQPANYAKFGADGSFEYRFNSNVSDFGTYQLVNGETVVATAGSKTFTWSILTMTNELFTTKSVSNNDPNFPGAILLYPGATIENYLTMASYR